MQTLISRDIVSHQQRSAILRYMFFISRCLLLSCKTLIISRCYSIELIILRKNTFLVLLRKRYLFITRNLVISFLKANYSLRVIFSNLISFFKVVNHSAIIYERKKQLSFSLEITRALISRTLIEISSILIKLLILTLFSSLLSSDFVLGRRESLFAVVCLIFRIWRTLKLNRRIYINYRVTRVPGKSALKRLS